MRYLYHLAATLLLTCSEAQAQNIWRVNQGAAGGRDPVVNPVRLSGNIGDPSSATDNSYHVLQGIGLDEHCLLDGFTVSDGYSRGSVDKELDQYGAGQAQCGGIERSNHRQCRAVSLPLPS